MIVKNEVEINQESVEYAKSVFEMYVETNELNKVIKNPIIHMYPKEDTYDNEGNLNGYCDALFFEAHVYDTENKTVYKSSRPHDAIMPFRELKIQQIKIFKDLSTMIVLRGTYKISTTFAAIDIEKLP